MANLNLSEFTEKTLVEDADWVFVWDTAGAISKKVSRNSLLNSGTLAGASAPVTVSQTWNDAAVAFTALKVNAVSTASATASLLLDLQVGGTSKVYFDKAGKIISASSANGGCYIGSHSLAGLDLISGAAFFTNTSGAIVSSINRSGVLGFSTTWDGVFAFGTSSTNANGFGADTILARDAANTLALRNSTAAQTFNVYGTYTSGTSYERLTLSAPSAANAIIGTNKGSGGGTARGLEFQTDGVTRMTIDSAGAASFGTNSVSCQNVILPAGGLLVWAGTGRITNPSTGVFQLLDGAQTSFNRLQFGGTTDSFPAVARDGAGIKFTGAAAGLTSHIKVPAVAVTSLPSAATAGVGARAFVNDALSPVFGSAVANGGSAKVPVYSDGSAWYVG
jgi:hypothetical protein